jgi:hypothetical protein
MAEGTFATAIACIDGRIQAPIRDWMRAFAHVDYVDMVTTPGSNAALAQGPDPLIEHLRQSVVISVTAHHSQVVAVTGHHDCAAYPVSREQHITDISAAARLVMGWNLPVRVVGLWVNDRWEVEPVWDSASGGPITQQR